MELSEFLLARIAEDEAVARDAAEFGPPPWHWGYGGPQGKYGLLTGSLPSWKTAGALIYGDMDTGAAQHIARHDPARVLAECDAKRRIVGMHRQYDYPGCDGDGPHGREDCDTLRLLALPYADHPDYDERWRV